MKRILMVAVCLMFLSGVFFAAAQAGDKTAEVKESVTAAVGHDEDAATKADDKEIEDAAKAVADEKDAAEKIADEKDAKSK